MRIGLVVTNDEYFDCWNALATDAGFEVRFIDPYANSVVEDLKGVDLFFWRISHFSAVNVLIARHVLYACRLLGIPAFPSLDTFRLFDDKVAQKYALEAVDVPFVPTYVFFEKQAALEWVSNAAYPKVFKLKCGAGSRNVRLVRSKSAAIRLVKQAFGRGFTVAGGNLSDAAGKVMAGTADFFGKLRRAPQTIRSLYELRMELPRERGYVYFQDFIPGNDYDTRITVLNGRAIGFRRAVRKNDFRASGSGVLDYDQGKIDVKCIEHSFRLSEELSSQSICVDYVTSPDGEPLVVEVSYSYVAQAVADCGGYWTKDLEYRPNAVEPAEAIFMDMLGAIDES